jgi:prepilin-type processing-associated H-X9-DG protein
MPNSVRAILRFLCFLGAVFCTVVFGIGMGAKVQGPSYVLLLIGLLGTIGCLLALAKLTLEDRRPGCVTEAIACLVVCMFLTAIMYPVFLSAKEASRKPPCVSNLKRLVLAELLYASDNGDKLPLATSWHTGIVPYIESSDLRCPESKAPFTYGMNRALSGANTATLPNPSRLVLLFEMDSSDQNANGGLESFAMRHDSQGNVGLADGSVKAYAPGDGSDLRWTK